MMADAVWDSFLASISQHLESCFDFNRPQLTFKNVKNDKWHWSYELKFMLIATYSKSIDNNYRTSSMDLPCCFYKVPYCSSLYLVMILILNFHQIYLLIFPFSFARYHCPIAFLFGIHLG